jgi:hypothetical protein
MVMIMADMRADLQADHRLPPLPEDKLKLALKFIVQQTFELCLACIESPQQRPALLQEAEQLFTWCLTGASIAAGLPVLPVAEPSGVSSGAKPSGQTR